MSMLKWHIKENARRIKNGDEPKDTPRYIVTHAGPFRGEIRRNMAHARFKADTPHGAGKSKRANDRTLRRIERKRRRRARTAQRGRR